MNKITTDFVGTETRAEVKTRLQAILDYWLGPGSTAGVSTWGDIRTLLNSVATPNYQIADGEVASSFRTKLNVLNTPDQHIASFFEQAGSQGWLYDLSDMSTLFQDAAGITPVTAVGQPVGLCLDKSKGLVRGPELGSVSSGWIGYGSSPAAVSYLGGVVTITNQGTTGGAGYSFATVSGRWYRLSISFSGGQAPSPRLRIGTSLGDLSIYNQVIFDGVTTLFFQATSTVTTVNIAHGASALGVSSIVSTISVRELPGNHRSQSASLPRPTYARHPLGGIRNLLTRTEEFENADWVKVAPVPLSLISGQPASDGSLTATKVTPNAITTTDNARLRQVVSLPNGGVMTWRVKANGLTFFNPTFNNSATLGASINLITAEVSGIGAGITEATAVFVENGFVEVTLKTNSAINTIEVYLRKATGFGGTTVYNGTDSMIISWPYVSDIDGPYQRVGSVFDVTEAGVPDLYYLSYDGINDFLSTAPFAWGSDKATICAGVRKLSDAAAGVFVELSTNAETTNGSIGLAVPGSSTRFIAISRGTVIQTASTTNAAYNAPTTRVATVLANIAADNLVLRLDGAQVAQNTADQGTGNFGTHAAFFGARAGTSVFFKGWEYSSVGINRLLTANELAALESWTAGKAGNTL